VSALHFDPADGAAKTATVSERWAALAQQSVTPGPSTHPISQDLGVRSDASQNQLRPCRFAVVSPAPHGGSAAHTLPVGENVRVTRGRRNRRHRLLWALLAALYAGAALVLGAGPASAHAELLSSDPADGATLASAPTRIRLTFGEDINPQFVQVALTTHGTVVTLAKPVVKGPVITAAIEGTMAGGDYILAFRVVSQDGHPISETVRFTLSGPPSATASANPPGTAPAPSVTDGATMIPPAPSMPPPQTEPAPIPQPTPTYKTPQRQPTTIGHPDHTPGIIVAIGLVLAGAVLAFVEHRRRGAADARRAAQDGADEP
jgi:methionine-rich copper-binding protein CopC